MERSPLTEECITSLSSVGSPALNAQRSVITYNVRDVFYLNFSWNACIRKTWLNATVFVLRYETFPRRSGDGGRVMQIIFSFLLLMKACFEKLTTLSVRGKASEWRRTMGYHSCHGNITFRKLCLGPLLNWITPQPSDQHHLYANMCGDHAGI